MSQPIQGSQGDTKTASAGGFDSNFFNQISGGNLAMALIMINKIMQLYMQLMQLRAQLTNTELDVQLASTKASADAVQNADLDQGNALISQGSLEIAGAAFSAGLSIGGRVRNSGFKTEMDKVDNEASPLRSLNKTMQTVNVEGVPGSGTASTAAPKEFDVDALNQRITDFKQGHFTASGDTELDAEAFKQLKATSTKENNMFDNARKALSLEIKNKESRISNLQSQYNNELGNWDMASRSASEVGRSSGQIASGIFTKLKAKEDSTIEFAHTNTQQAGTQISEGLAAMREEYQKAIQELQVLQKLQDAMRIGY